MMMGKVCLCAVLVLFAFLEVCHAFNAAPHHQGGVQCLRKVSTTLFSTAAESSLALSGDGDDLANFQFPEPLTPGQRAQRSVQFYSKIAPLLLRYATFEKGLQGMSELEKEAKWDELHEWGSEILSNTIKDLKGFYVKTGQVISTRVDLFPMQYTTKLMMLQDSVDPVDAQQIKAIVRQELLEGEPLSTLFRSFEDAPLGSASIAQVHKAVLNDGRTVAVKVQRPSEEPKLRGDIKNLKTFAKLFADQLPVDYYTVFCELERALTNELDFRAEAQAMEKIAATVAYKVDGTPAAPPLFVPRPVPGLCTGRVLVMEFVEGVSLNRLAEEMEREGIQGDADEAKVLGTKLLIALTEAFGRMFFGPGFIHGDPHPGNIFVQKNGNVALIDCGQVKQLPSSMQLKLAEVINMINRYNDPSAGVTTKDLADRVRVFGVKVNAPAEKQDDCLAAIALLLFGPTGIKLPGGYSNKELDDDSPLKAVLSFPQELVMMGRATVLIKGIASKLNIKWNLGQKWDECARMCMQCSLEGCAVPVYAATPAPLGGQAAGGVGGSQERVKFSDVRQQLRGLRRVAKDWALAKGMEVAPEGVKKMIIRRMAKGIEENSTLEEEEAAAAAQALLPPGSEEASAVGTPGSAVKEEAAPSVQ
mmetsp:Transcript_58798/g.86054  ORF Transcript_58798/g.86054 Transcript_58798/m.86054 type:complete len:644 (-) Transcript_58798:444-2375(-)